MWINEFEKQINPPNNSGKTILNTSPSRYIILYLFNMFIFTSSFLILPKQKLIIGQIASHNTNVFKT